MKTTLSPDNVVGRSEDGVKIVKTHFSSSCYAHTTFALSSYCVQHVLIARVFRRVPRLTRSCYALTTLVLGATTTAEIALRSYHALIPFSPRAMPAYKYCDSARSFF
ncbi:hypothetical protein DPMN_053538 [Dreissena polymorpha]|uniref:Uncharacterized protein n=1 Tax=Dreissena polymorpha TaxID=45954 RepID=A0A9D4HQC6_DREPO|nr:hypothetical protein DPMN_053538 [Dreissena polymorpha]